MAKNTMLVLLHGENTVSSRKRLAELVRQAEEKGLTEKITLEGKTLTLTDLKQALEAKSLFGEGKIVVVENFLSLRTGKEKEQIINYLVQLRGEVSLLLWENKQLTQAVIARLTPTLTIEIFKVEPLVFRFLDSLRPKNAKEMLNLLHLSLRQKEPELIFYLLIKRFHYLILAKDLQGDGLDSLPPWQQRKILGQAKHFTLAELRSGYARLLEIDFRRKTSAAPSFQTLLDLFIISP